MKRVVILLLIPVFFAVGLLAGEQHKGLILRDMDGKRTHVDSLLVTGPVILNFWATWCPPCKIEMPHLEKIAKELSTKDVHFAAISLDSRRNKSHLEKYIEKNKMALPVYRDPEGTLARRFRVIAIPTTIVLDQSGQIHYSARGYKPGDEIVLKKKIEALIRPAEDGSEPQQSGQ
jgi:thiol-disulfide isomerase/thioredoxin